MEEQVKEPTQAGASSVDSEKNTAEVTFGGTKYTIHRLKAGKFYDALKIYMDMIKEVAPNAPVSGEGQATVDFDKLVVSMFQTWPEKMVKFIAVCCSTIEGDENKITEEKIREEAYPEEITASFRTCLQLNKVGENLKNFVAPIGELGAQMQPDKVQK
jgi:hypothetical protein